jgi:16S rRNA (cytosine1402-N4)-methyltransferase
VNVNKPEHKPVMLNQVVSLFCEASPQLLVDGTLGLGGHAEALLRALPNLVLVGMDGDQHALHLAKRRLLCFEDRINLVHSPYCEMREVLKDLGYEKVDGVFLDLGLSSLQVDDAERGFSFVADGPLDMRMDRESEFSAWNVVNQYSQEDLERVIREYGEERWARRIALKIVEARQISAINTTAELADLVAKAIPRRFHPRRIHPATRTFQAIRIEVNRELECLEAFLGAIPGLLNPGGRVVVVSFHSLEDRMVKHAFRNMENQGLGRRITKRPLRPTEEEIDTNPRARSAKLRCFEVRL